MASQQRKVVISSAKEVSDDQRENYNKVILHKQMLLPVETMQKSEKELEINDSSSPGLVKRRVLEMSQETSLTRNAGSRNSPTSSPRSSNRPRNQYKSPKRGQESSPQFEPRSKLLMGPKPFKSTVNENPRPMSFRRPESASSPQQRSHQSMPKRSHHKIKPVVPPKPRNVSVKQKYSPIRINSQQQKCQQQPMGTKKVLDNIPDHDQNDSGVSEEADDVFNDTPIRNCSFTSLSQKIDDQRFDLLKRRQSYSEFEDLIEKKRELRERMLSKIMFLREERDLLMEEKAENDILGKTIAHNLEGVARNSELDKYRQFLEEIEQITKLTVSLTIRLSRLSKKLGTTAGSFTKVETAMQHQKKSRLVDQLNEADILHRNTDRRSGQVRNVLSKYLNPSDLNEYDNFLVNLIQHITDLKETEQRIQLGEEQLIALNDNLIALPK